MAAGGRGECWSCDSPGNECVYANDHECDEPQGGTRNAYCAAGTDSADCGRSTAAPVPALTCTSQAGKCSSDACTCPPKMQKEQHNRADNAGHCWICVVLEAALTDSCSYAHDDECDEPRSVDDVLGRPELDVFLECKSTVLFAAY